LTPAGTCRASPIPVEPVDPDLAIPPIACDEREYAAHGAFSSHVANELDASGRPLASRSFDLSGSVVTTTTTQWDGCGHMLSTETKDAYSVLFSYVAEYRPDGLLQRQATTSPGSCGEESEAYTFDAQGRVAIIYDSITCKTTAELSYDDAGRVSRLKRPTNQTDYAYHPNGTLKEVTFSSDYGTHYDHFYDNRGRPLSFNTNMTGGSTGDDLSRVWTYDAAGRLKEYSRVLDGISCNYHATTTTYEYDAAGKLSRTTATSPVMGARCSIQREDTVVTTFTYPSPSVTVATVLDANGTAVSRTTTTVDAAGRAIRSTIASAPDFVEQPVFVRDYGCLSK